MAKNNPKSFSVFAIKSGERFGLLLEKGTWAEKYNNRAYFCFRGPNHLPPNEQILRACGDCIYPLTPSSDEKIIMTLLKKCAEFCEDTDPPCREIPLKEVYKGAEDYIRVAQRFFDTKRGAGDSELRRFLGSYGHFKAHILEKRHGEDVLILKAGEFGVLSPHEVMPDEELHYLKHIRHVLKVGVSEEPRWFRKSGPIAADFKDKRIHVRRQKLDELETLVMNNSVSMLVGTGATGKTVLVLNLCYELDEKDNLRVYYFDCDKDRGFDKIKLLNEIKCIRGVCILENIHLTPEKFQSVYSEFKHDKNKHILFTSRPSFREFQYSRSEDLTQIKTLRIEPFDDVDALIKTFSAHPKGPEIPREIAGQIKGVSSKSFWLLSYALEGYTRSDGKGDPKKWLETGVKEDLNDLKNINTVFPEVLVALSPLYLNEVLTVESFLLGKLGFDYEVLDQLVKRGEITCQITEDGHVFYGMPHSVLAEAYLEHGKEYRERRQLPEYEDFIYDYAKSGVANALEAVQEARPGVRERLLDHLVARDELAAVIANEMSMETIDRWAEVVDPGVLGESSVVRTLVRKMENHDDPGAVAECLGTIFTRERRTGCRIWNLIDKNKLANAIMRQDSIFYIGSDIDSFGFEGSIGFEICNLLDLKRLAWRLDQEKDFLDLRIVISSICRTCIEAGRQLWRLLDHDKLAAKMRQTDDLFGLIDFVDMVYRFDLCRALEAEGIMTLEELAEKVNGTRNVYAIGHCVKKTFRITNEIGCRLWRLLDKMNLAHKLIRITNVNAVSNCLTNIRSGHQHAASELCRMIPLKEFAVKLNQAEGKQIVALFRAVFCANKAVGHKLWRLLDRKSLASRLSDSRCDDLIGLLLLRDIGEVDAEAGRELCDLIDVEERARELNNAEDPWTVGTYLYRISNVHQNTADKLWYALDKEKLAAILSKPKCIGAASLCIYRLYFADMEIGYEICNLLDLENLASKLNSADDVTDTGNYILSICIANPQVGLKLWQLLDKGRLGAWLSAMERNPRGYELVPVRTLNRSKKDITHKCCALRNVRDVCMTLKARDRDDFRLFWKTIKRADEDGQHLLYIPNNRPYIREGA